MLFSSKNKKADSFKAMQIFTYSLIFIVSVLIVVGVALNAASKPEFLSQCQQDGFTKTECEMMWSEKNRVYSDNF